VNRKEVSIEYGGPSTHAKLGPQTAFEAQFYDVIYRCSSQLGEQCVMIRNDGGTVLNQGTRVANANGNAGRWQSASRKQDYQRNGNIGRRPMD
jgi:hypothetical protein